jgi:hypothetical protein
MLISKALGFLLNRFAWNACLEGMIWSHKPRPDLGNLLNLQFDEIGSLFKEDREYDVKECLSPH